MFVGLAYSRCSEAQEMLLPFLLFHLVLRLGLFSLCPIPDLLCSLRPNPPLYGIWPTPPERKRSQNVLCARPLAKVTGSSFIPLKTPPLRWASRESMSWGKPKAASSSSKNLLSSPHTTSRFRPSWAREKPAGTCGTLSKVSLPWD